MTEEMQFTDLTQPDIATKIRAKLTGLGVKGFFIGEPIVGPVVTGYPLTLKDSTPLSKIISKAEEIALACHVDSVDIRRVKSQVIIYIPNEKRTIVDFKDALFWYLKDEEVRKMELPILLGVTVDGRKAAMDLVNQPHVLIAGSTGAGKSVFESAIIAALATIKEEKELKLYLVDTKRVDLGLFEKVPAVQQVIRDVTDWYSFAERTYQDVQNRNKAFEAMGVRNIREFNNLPEFKNKKMATHKMAYKVVIIDELADLIEKDKGEREFIKAECKANDQPVVYPFPPVIDAIKRIIQVSRAAGIHIIACTQRTSVDVVSGTVKANFPTRISLRLPSSVDSRVILGANGAENLLGKGDMLVQKDDSEVFERFHAPFVQLSDIEWVVNNKQTILDTFNIEWPEIVGE
jgi:DNA segregation ATPase FtsK/SpoIIIE, S-DNA-T family